MKIKLTGQNILDAFNDIEDVYIQSAWERLYKKQKHTKVKSMGVSVLKKAAIVFAVIILSAFTSVMTVMAVNAQFREAVKEVIFEFFHIEEKEIIPEFSVETEITTENMYVEQDRSIIGDVIEGRYVHAPVSCHAREGVFTICTDEIELKQGSHYDAYYEENGNFIQLEEHSFSGDYNVQGQDLHISFKWVVYNGQTAVTYIEAEENFRIPANPGRADAMMLEVVSDSMDNVYPLQVNLYTGEATDLLDGTGAEKLSGICNYALAEDRSKMLLAKTDGELYYVDLIGKKLYSINELSGEKVDSCSLIGDSISCWVEEGSSYRGWNIDLVNFERRELFLDLQKATPETGNTGIICLSGFNAVRHWGTMYGGAHFALIRDELGAVAVLDLKTGEEISVEGFIWPDNWYQDILWEMNPDGRRLLISGGQVGSRYEYIGVLDFEKQTYLEFSRENDNQVYEKRPYWFAKDTVIIPAAQKDSYYVQDYYVYDLLGEDYVIIEGMAEKSDTSLYEGAGYTIRIPDEGWKMSEPGQWAAEANDTVRLWIQDYTGKKKEEVCRALSVEGFAKSEEDDTLYSYEDDNHIVKNVKFFEMDNKLTGVFYQYPAEAVEGFGVRLAKIASTFSYR